jgi:hypothetical protein
MTEVLQDLMSDIGVHFKDFLQLLLGNQMKSALPEYLSEAPRERNEGFAPHDLTDFA